MNQNAIFLASTRRAYLDALAFIKSEDLMKTASDPESEIELELEDSGFEDAEIRHVVRKLKRCGHLPSS